MGIEDRDYFQEDRAKRAAMPYRSGQPQQTKPVRVVIPAQRPKARLPELGPWLAWIVIGVAVFLVVVGFGLAKP